MVKNSKMFNESFLTFLKKILKKIMNIFLIIVTSHVFLVLHCHVHFSFDFEKTKEPDF